MPNPGIVTLLSLRTAIRQRADMVNSTFVTDAELNGYINSSYQELYDLLVQKYGDNWYSATPSTITTDGVNDKFSLPADLYKLLAVDLLVSAGSYISVPRFNFADRNKFSPYTTNAATGRTNVAYQLLGSQLWLMPLPVSGQTLRLFYVPRLATLVNDADTLDGVSGWEELIVTDCVIKCLQKEESDCSVPMAQKQQLLQRIEAAAENRDAGSPKTVSMTYGPAGFDGFWPWGY